jgi:hypothetical protein
MQSHEPALDLNKEKQKKTLQLFLFQQSAFAGVFSNPVLGVFSCKVPRPKDRNKACDIRRGVTLPNFFFLIIRPEGPGAVGKY